MNPLAEAFFTNAAQPMSDVAAIKRTPDTILQQVIECKMTELSGS